MYPMRISCTQVAGTLASDVFEADRTGVLDGPGFGCTSPCAEVVGRNRVRWSAAQLSNESALPRTTDSTRISDKCCMFIVSKALLISSATVIVRAGEAIWLNPFATVLFTVCSAVTMECCVLYPCCVGAVI